jgi:hypothetical protein
MDREKGCAYAKLYFFAVVMLIATAAFSYEEAILALKGRETGGQITKVSEERTRRSTVRKIEYQFIDSNNNERSGTTYVRLDWPIPGDGKLVIRYAGTRSRPAGETRWLVPVLFVASGVFVVAATAWFLITSAAAAAETVDRPRRKTRRRTREW